MLAGANFREALPVLQKGLTVPVRSMSARIYGACSWSSSVCSAPVRMMNLDLLNTCAPSQKLLQRAQASGFFGMQVKARVAMANTRFRLGDKEETLACLRPLAQCRR